LGSIDGHLSDSKNAENSDQKMPGLHYWVGVGIYSVLVLPVVVRYDAEFFYASVLPDIEKNLRNGKRRETPRDVYLHLNNAAAHSAKRSWQEIARIKDTRVVHPGYSPDTAPSDFLFGHLKGEMAGAQQTHL
jgi:hypothetical protein